jgi:hypothetical protein
MHPKAKVRAYYLKLTMLTRARYVTGFTGLATQFQSHATQYPPYSEWATPIGAVGRLRGERRTSWLRRSAYIYLIINTFFNTKKKLKGKKSKINMDRLFIFENKFTILDFTLRRRAPMTARARDTRCEKKHKEFYRRGTTSAWRCASAAAGEIEDMRRCDTMHHACGMHHRRARYIYDNTKFSILNLV